MAISLSNASKGLKCSNLLKKPLLLKSWVSKDLKVVFVREALGCALYAEVKTNRIVNFEADIKFLSIGDYINSKISKKTLCMQIKWTAALSRPTAGWRLGTQYLTIRGTLCLLHAEAHRQNFSIKDGHKQILHGGPKQTEADLRSQLWVIQVI